jgi:hypothetical protein
MPRRGHWRLRYGDSTMSNDLLNVRLFYWHLHIGPDYRFYVRLAFNKYHVGRGSPWFEIYD